MRAVVQRVRRGGVETDGHSARIGRGFVVLLGVGKEDNEADVRYMAEKLVNLRVFEDAQGKMNLSVRDVDGEMLIISQFTLYGDVRKGRRPGFDAAARPEEADRLYRMLTEQVAAMGVHVETGRFQTHMEVDIQNSGPVTILIDSQKQF